MDLELIRYLYPEVSALGWALVHSDRHSRRHSRRHLSLRMTMRSEKHENICNVLPAFRLRVEEVLLIFSVSGLRLVGSVLDAARFKDS